MKQNLMDQAEFEVVAGRGGNGCVSFRRERGVLKGGPDGGDGGDGGSIWLVADVNLATLKKFAGKDRFEANNGGAGRSWQKTGRKAEDVEIKVPVGTQIRLKIEDSRFKNNTETQEQWRELADLDKAGQRVRVARGGRGGRGNEALKSSINTTPRVAEPGEAGERFELRLELKILADIGLVGVPNVGKSSLLAVLTAAKPEIADYPFTTITPNLGVLRLAQDKLVIADIPGLIEDAHEGKGLGVAFLRHIERCKALVFVLAAEGQIDEASVGQELWQQYLAVKKELEAYGQDLAEKPAMVVVNKGDLIVNFKFFIFNFFREKGVEILIVSALTGEGLEELREKLVGLVKA